jgi:2-iminobutanoate/2-iminopropanoate deaminase
LKNIKAVLEAAGSCLGRVVKLNVYITDMRNFADMNEAYLGVFEEPQPVSPLSRVGL